MTKFIKLEDGTKVPVSEEVYRACKRPQWREQKRKKDRKVKKKIVKPPLSYDRLVESGYPIEKHFEPAPSPEEMVERGQTLELLYSALETLAEEEQALLDALFYEGMTEREYADSIGVSQQAVNKRRRKLLAKLRKLMGGKFF